MPAHADYMANYYRWARDPRGAVRLGLNLLALWARVTTTSISMRLPTLLMALACWSLISRKSSRGWDMPYDQQSGGVNGGGHVFGGVAAPGQRAAAGADHRGGHLVSKTN